MMGVSSQPRVPLPTTGERPAVYADRVGQWHAATASGSHRQRLGQYLTPVDVAMFMARLYTPTDVHCLRVLDPGAGAGILSCALVEVLATSPGKPETIELEAYEVAPDLATCLLTCLAYARQWSQTFGITLQFEVHTEDFVLAHAEALDDTPRLFSTRPDASVPFDVVISNPPYCKIPKSDPRAQAAATVVHGQPNLYALFMAVSAALLKPGGELIVISPRSYAAGPYFRRFREHFFAAMRPEAIHLFDSRRDAFGRDQVLQENVVLRARRMDGWPLRTNRETVQVSSSAGAHDLAQARQREVMLAEILEWTSQDKVLRIPVDDTDDATARIVRSWSGGLHACGLEISTGPVVPFRATLLLDQRGQVPGVHAPLLWMQNVQSMRVTWPAEARGKPQYIKVHPEAMPLLVADRNYVLLRRFSAKEQHRRLTAAPLLAGALGSPFIGLENHLNYIHRPGGSLSEAEAYGLAMLLNSRLLDAYFRTFSGNTQVSATELRAMPLPPLEIIVEIGQRALALPDPSGMEIPDHLIHFNGDRFLGLR